MDFREFHTYAQSGKPHEQLNAPVRCAPRRRTRTDRKQMFAPPFLLCAANKKYTSAPPRVRGERPCPGPGQSGEKTGAGREIVWKTCDEW
jgi:hypothetical protein